MNRLIFAFIAISLIAITKVSLSQNPTGNAMGGFTDAASFGFSPTATGVDNIKALQVALDKGGTIVVSKPGTYKVSGTAYIGDNTSLVFGAGVVLEKSNENGRFTHVFLNKGAMSRTYNQNITIAGLDLRVNGVDRPFDSIYGLRGHVAFFYIKDLKIERLRISGLVNGQFALHICTFEDLLINDAIIKGKKDGIHLGPGKRFKISNCVFQTGDDAIALVPGDWVTANPEFGILEDGVIENCSDVPDDYLEGAFAKIVASGWTDWKPGMKLRHGDCVVSNGRLYRVAAKNDGKVYISSTRPEFEDGQKMIDSINWLMFQKDTIHTAFVRNVVFRDIFLHSVRVPFQVMCYNIDIYAHSYYPGAPKPVMSNITLDNVNILSETPRAVVAFSSPCDIFTIKNSSFKNGYITFQHARNFDKYPPTWLNIANCTFTNPGANTIVSNVSPGKEVFLKTSGSLVVSKNFTANVKAGPGVIHVDSDLPGLKK
jgi:hypothetical protein